MQEARATSQDEREALLDDWAIACRGDERSFLERAIACVDVLESYSEDCVRGCSDCVQLQLVDILLESLTRALDG